MKPMNRVLLLWVVLAVMLTGCGGGNKAAQMMKKSAETMASVTSLEAEMKIETSLSMNGETIATVTQGEISTFVKPMKLKAEVSTNGADGETLAKVMEMYVVEEGEVLTSYLDMGTGWMSENVEKMTLGHYNIYDNVNSYLGATENLKTTGEEEVDGKMTTRIDGQIRGEAIRQVTAHSGVLETVQQMGITEEDMADMFDKVQSLPVSFWIGEDGYVYQYEINLAPVVKVVMDMTMVMMGMDPGEEAFAVIVDIATVTVTCSDFNKVAPFEIPRAALEASSAG